MRVICTDCKEEVTPEKKALKEIGVSRGELSGATLYQGRGCAECDFTGYRGRMGRFELLVMTDPMKELVLEKRSANVIKELAKDEGMIVLREDGWQKVQNGITSVEEVLRVTQDEVLL